MEGTANAMARPIRWVQSWFLAHPSANGITYMEHTRRALWMSVRMGWGSLVLAVHAVFPFWFETTGSGILHTLVKETESYNPARARAASTSTSRQCGFSPALAYSEEERSMPLEGKEA